MSYVIAYGLDTVLDPCSSVPPRFIEIDDSSVKKYYQEFVI